MQGPPFDKILSPGSPIWYKFCFHMFHYRTLLNPWLKYPYILSVCYLWIEYSENNLLWKTLSRTPGTTLRTTALFERSAKQLELFALESHRQLSQFPVWFRRAVNLSTSPAPSACDLASPPLTTNHRRPYWPSFDMTPVSCGSDAPTPVPLQANLLSPPARLNNVRRRMHRQTASPPHDPLNKAVLSEN